MKAKNENISICFKDQNRNGLHLWCLIWAKALSNPKNPSFHIHSLLLSPFTGRGRGGGIAEAFPCRHWAETGHNLDKSAVLNKKKKKSTNSVGVYSFIYLYLINPSLFTEMGESRLKMNLLYTSSSVKGHSVQCRRCLQCIYTRYVTVRMHFRWPKPQSAQ